MIVETVPDAVVHLAAYSAASALIVSFPPISIIEYTLLTAHVFDAAARATVGKLLYTMGGCSYPRDSEEPNR